MREAVLIYTTWPGPVEAETAGRALVEAGLAACVNILPGMRSVYRWQGAVEASDEAVMIVKTTCEAREAAMTAIRKAHPYETPAIIALSVIAGDPGYLAWIADSVTP
jgi:periplasmic divalent cation tolerance protein